MELGIGEGRAESRGRSRGKRVEDTREFIERNGKKMAVMEMVLFIFLQEALISKISRQLHLLSLCMVKPVLALSKPTYDLSGLKQAYNIVYALSVLSLHIDKI